MRSPPVLTALAALTVLWGSRSWSQPASTPPSSQPQPAPAARLMLGVMARFAVVLHTLVAPSTTNLDSLGADGSVLTIPARSRRAPADLPEENDRGPRLDVSTWPIGDRICSSPQTCCQLNGGIWMDGRCH